MTPGALIQVSSETVDRCQAGKVGTAHSLLGNAVYYIACGSKTGQDKKAVGRSDCVALHELPVERADRKKQLQHLSASDCDKWQEHWHVTDFAVEEVRQDSMLDFTELDASAFEILWRVQPAKTVYFLPFSLA